MPAMSDMTDIPNTVNVEQELVSCQPEGAVQSDPNALSTFTNHSVVMLSTAEVKIQDCKGNYQTMRALIDSGSQAHFISENAARRLGFTSMMSSRNISTLGTTAAMVTGSISCCVGKENETYFKINMLTLPVICGIMPSMRLDPSPWKHVKNLRLADPQCNIPGPIDVLLGAEVFPELLLPGRIDGEANQPSAINSLFGWLLIGKTSVPSNQASSNLCTLFCNDVSRHGQVKKMWELEEISSYSKLTPDEELCERKFQEEIPEFPDSRDITLRSFHLLECHIQEVLPGSCWHHVSSSENPADGCSRGALPSDLIEHPLWWAGPVWLSKPCELWPAVKKIAGVQDIVNSEECVAVCLTEPITNILDKLMEEHSALSGLFRVVAYCLRLVHNLRDRSNRSNGPLSNSELHNALIALVKGTQQLSTEVDQLQKGKPLPKPLRKLNPFIDNKGVLRVGGRLARSGLAYEHKHPALLPRECDLTKLIMRETYRSNCRPGITTSHDLVSPQFWILSRRAIQSALQHCVRYFRMNPKVLEPFISDLPATRVDAVQEFLLWVWTSVVCSIISMEPIEVLKLARRILASVSGLLPKPFI